MSPFFLDLVWMLAWSFHGLCAPTAGWEWWLQGPLWRQKCISFTQIFSLSSCCRASLGGNLGSDMITWINSCALHCSHWASEQPLLGLHLGQRRPIWYSMICEDVPRQCLKFLPLGSTFSFSCNGAAIACTGWPGEPLHVEKCKAERWKDLVPWGAHCCGIAIAGHWVLRVLQRDYAYI